MEYVYEALTIDECIKLAEAELNISAEDFDYEVIEKKGMLRRKYKIRVSPKNNTSNYDGKVSVKNGNFIVTNPQEQGTPAKIFISKDINLYIDDKKVEDFCSITENNSIRYDIINQEAKRELNIVKSDDDMTAMASVKYVPKRVYKLCDSENVSVLNLNIELEYEEYPPKFNELEIKKVLTERGIVSGVILENLKTLCTGNEQGEILIAEGKKVKETVQDRLTILFKDKQKRIVSEDETIDFRNMNQIVTVQSGEIIATLIKGSEGKPGINISGKVIKPEKYKELQLNAGEGCKIDGSNIIAIEDGRPDFKNNTISVNKIYEATSDVNLASGNLNFTGDIHIGANVSQGMTIKAGKSISIDGSVEGSHIISNDQTLIKGSIIGSTIEAGGKDFLIQQQLDELENLKSSMLQLTSTVLEIKEHNLLGIDRSDGEIIKVLIENKFKSITTNSLNIIRLFSKSDEEGRNIGRIVKQMLVGLGPTTIKHFSELDKLVVLADEYIKNIQGKVNIPADISINYCQDSTISSSGNIYLNGKGQYISHLTCSGSIIFTQNGSVSRGGYLKAENEIRCKTIGSTGGVKTKASVSKNGSIYADIAYHNTIFAIGEREIVLEEPSRDIHVYMDELGDIIIDKFRL
ncbi:FapA family protein [Clostridium sp. YIM B02505]|uniref:FapA family protein n=1 Tax=Clostridium yunnanense TaxID=2800325 RepID=A0ABS1EUA0_9CLOT|nr:flagellar assembly protein A [Clostridium yunnanense]MBK1812955.1 FapA family protein [Clostridium yunnanense]